MNDIMKKCKVCSPMVLRIFFGVAFLIAGIGKLFSLDMTVGFFSQLFGGAGWLAYPVMLVEIVGGILLLVDWHAMEASVVLAIIMLVAFVVTFKTGAGVLATLEQIVSSPPLLYLVGVVSIAMQGCKQCEEMMK